MPDLGRAAAPNRTTPPLVSNAARRASALLAFGAAAHRRGQCAGPSRSMSYRLEKASSIAPEGALQQRVPHPGEPLRTHECREFFARDAGTVSGETFADARRNALRRDCVVAAAGVATQLYCGALRCCARRAKRASRRATAAGRFMAIDMPHAGVQRITAARGVEARFLWKRFWRSRNDARP